VTRWSSAPRPEEVSSALRRMLAGRFPGEVTDAETPIRINGGLDFWVYGLHFSGIGLPPPWTTPLVARIPIASERFTLLEHESKMQAWVSAQGYPAPPILDLVPPGESFEFPVQVMKRMAGSTMAEAIVAAPWRVLQFAGQLGASHANLHLVPVPGWACTGREWTLADARLRLARYLVSNTSHPGLGRRLNGPSDSSRCSRCPDRQSAMAISTQRISSSIPTGSPLSTGPTRV
jgi:hypothetical protein